MKKLFAATLIVLSLMVIRVMADNRLTAPFSFSIAPLSNTELIVSFSDSNDIAPDSLAIVDTVGDTTWFQYTTPVTGTTSYTDTVTSLTPHTQYIMAVIAERNDTENVLKQNEDYLFIVVS
jgi:hypothetical protein